MTEAGDPVPVVVHASVALEIAVGERPDVPAAWRRWLADDRLLLVPAAAWAEVGEALMRHLGRDAADAAGRIETLEASGIEIADRGASDVRMALPLAARHGLTVPEAMCLWLAIDVNGDLATLDRALAGAARVEGVGLAIEP